MNIKEIEPHYDPETKFVHVGLLTEDEFHHLYFALLWCNDTLNQDLLESIASLRGFKHYGFKIGNENVTKLYKRLSDLHSAYCKDLKNEYENE